MTPEIQREMLCGKKDLSLLKLCSLYILLEGGNRLMRFSREFASSVNPTLTVPGRGVLLPKSRKHHEIFRDRNFRN